MQYTQNPQRWKKWFALLPTEIAKDRCGRKVSVWLEFYEYRFVGDTMYGPRYMYRAIGRPDLKPFEFVEFV